MSATEVPKTVQAIFDKIENYLSAFGDKKPTHIALYRKEYKSLLAFYNRGRKLKDQLTKVPDHHGIPVRLYDSKLGFIDEQNNHTPRDTQIQSSPVRY